MSAIDFDQIIKELVTGVESLAKDSLKDYENEAKADGKALVDDTKADLLQWTKELETGSINREDVVYLLQEDEDLGKMTALKEAGLAQVRIDEFRNSVINLIVGTITGLVKI